MNSETKEYIDNQIGWTRSLLATEVNAIQVAVNKEAVTNSDRAAVANEFRGQLKDQAREFVTRRELWIMALGFLTLVVTSIGLIISIII